MPAVITPWTDEIIGFIREYVEQGNSSTQIARLLSTRGFVTTRNAVIGVCNRRGILLKQRSISDEPKTKKPRIGKPRASRARVNPLTVKETRIQDAQERVATMDWSKSFIPGNPVAIVDLTNSNCHWPLGAFADRPPFMYCGDPVFVGCYCLRHFQVATVSKETRYARPTRNIVIATAAE